MNYTSVKKLFKRQKEKRKLDLEIITLSELSQRKTNISYHVYTESKKNFFSVTNELIHKTETDSQSYRMNLWLPRGRGGREGDINIYIDIYS